MRNYITLLYLYCATIIQIFPGFCGWHNYGQIHSDGNRKSNLYLTLSTSIDHSVLNMTIFSYDKIYQIIISSCVELVKFNYMITLSFENKDLLDISHPYCERI